MRRFTPSAYFLWIFGAYNLLNSGYLVASAVLNSSDWANVIAGLSPPWLWRCVLGLAGATLYVLAIRWTASSMLGLVNRGEVALVDLQRLVLPAYLTAGAVMTIASVFNPISPTLILLSGAGASFAAGDCRSQCSQSDASNTPHAVQFVLVRLGDRGLWSVHRCAGPWHTFFQL